MLLLLAASSAGASGCSPDGPSSPAAVATSAPPHREQAFIVEVAAGPESTCVRSKAGRVACIGEGMGYDEDTEAFDTATAQEVDLPPSKGIAAGAGFACSVDRDGGRVRCWGANHSGQLGRSSAGRVDHWPQPVPDLDGVEQLVSHGSRTCALREQTVLCWPADAGGLEEHPLQGRSTLEALHRHVHLGARLEPTQFRLDRPDPCPLVDPQGEDEDEALSPSPGCEAMTVELGDAVGFNHVCSIRDGRLQCQGDDSRGQIPVDAPGGLVDVAVGSEHTCAVTHDGTLTCWGSSSRGQLGFAPVVNRPKHKVATDVAAAWATEGLTCYQDHDGQVRCAGGSGDACSPPAFSPLDGPNGIREMFDVFGTRGCLLDTAGSLWCHHHGDWREQLPSKYFPGRAEDRRSVVASPSLCWLDAGRATCAGWSEDFSVDAFGESEADARTRGLRDDTDALGPLRFPFGPARDGAQLTAAANHLCLLRTSGDVECLSPGQSTPAPFGKNVEAMFELGWVLRDGSVRQLKTSGHGYSLREISDPYTFPDGPAKRYGRLHTLLRSGVVLDSAGDPLDLGVKARALLEPTPGRTCVVDTQNALWCWGDLGDGAFGGGDPACTRQGASLRQAFSAALEAPQ